MGDFSSGSAARTSPAFSASLNDWKSAAVQREYVSGGWRRAAQFVAAACTSPEEASGFERPRIFWRFSCFGSDEREAPNWFEQAHFGHGGFDGAGIGFDEIHFHEREILFLKFAGVGEIVFEAGVHEARHFRGNFVGGDGDYAASA